MIPCSTGALLKFFAVIWECRHAKAALGPHNIFCNGDYVSASFSRQWFFVPNIMLKKKEGTVISPAIPFYFMCPCSLDT